MELIARYNRQHKGKKDKDALVLDGETNANPADDTIPHDDSGSEVSDHDNPYMNNGDADDMLDLADHTKPSNSKINNSAINTSVGSIISEEYEEVEPSSNLPAIDLKLSEIVTKWLRAAPPRERIHELFKDCMLPENIEGLLPVKINDLLYTRLSLESRINDQKLRGINTFIARGLGPLLSIWDKLLKFESALINKSDREKFSIEDGTIKVGEDRLNVTEIRRDMVKGLRLLCTCHGVVLQKRRDQLRGLLDPKFHVLLKPSNPVTLELLGDNVDQKIADNTKLLEAAQKLQVRRTHPPPAGGGFQRGNPYRVNPGWCPFFSCGKRQAAALYRGGFNSRSDSSQYGSFHNAPKHGRFQRGRQNGFMRSRYPRRR